MLRVPSSGRSELNAHESQLTAQNLPAPDNPNQVGEVISKIEDIFESIADSIGDGTGPLVIYLKLRRRRGSQSVVNGTDKRKKIVFPSKSPKEAWRFSRLNIVYSSVILTAT